MSPPHSPLPWTVNKKTSEIFDANRRFVALTYSGLNGCCEADADLIVTAVNAHEKMRKALRFYADSDAWHVDDEKEWPAARLDGGKIARAALAGG